MRLIVHSFVFLCFSIFSLCADAVYFTGNTSQTVSVIDPTTNTIIATISVGVQPQGIGILPNQQFAYVPNNGANSVSVINLSTNTVVATIVTGIPGQPFGPLIAPDGHTVYVFSINTQGGLVALINPNTNTVTATVPGPNSRGYSGYTITGDGQKIYLGSLTVNPSISVFDTNTNAFTATIASTAIVASEVTNNGQILYDGVVGNNVQVINTSNLTAIIGTIPLSSLPLSLKLNNAGTLLYITKQGGGVNIVNTSTLQIVATITVGTTPQDIALNGNETLAYVTNFGSDNISVINLSTNAVIATISDPGSGPFRITYLTTLRPTGTITGFQSRNRFLTQTDYINTISWEVASSTSIAFYKIYRDAALSILAAEVGGTTFEFEDHNRKPKTFYSYFLVAVDVNGNSTEIGSVTIAPI